MKNSINRYFIAAIVAIVAVTWGISIIFLYLSNENTQNIGSTVSMMSTKMEGLQRSVDQLTIDKEIKSEIITIQEQDIRLKDSLLDMRETQNKGLTQRLYRTQLQLKETREEVKSYAKILDSLSVNDNIRLDRFKLNGNSPK